MYNCNCCGPAGCGPGGHGHGMGMMAHAQLSDKDLKRHLEMKQRMLKKKLEFIE